MKTRIDYKEYVEMESSIILEFRLFGRRRELNVSKLSDRLQKMNWFMLAFLLGECLIRFLLLGDVDALSPQTVVILNSVGDIVFTIIMVLLVMAITLYLLVRTAIKEEERRMREFMYRVITRPDGRGLFIVNQKGRQDSSRLERIRRDRASR